MGYFRATRTRTLQKPAPVHRVRVFPGEGCGYPSAKRSINYDLIIHELYAIIEPQPEMRCFGLNGVRMAACLHAFAKSQWSREREEGERRRRERKEGRGSDGTHSR